MHLFKRLTDIISANMQEMISNAENPEPMLRQAVREMGDSIAEAKAATARAIANEKLLRRKLADHETTAAQWTSRAEEAVGKSDDETARQALSRKQEHVRIGAALSDQLGAASDSAQTLRRQLDAMAAKLAEAKRSLATLTARHQAAQVRQATIEPEIRSDAFAKFDRMTEKVEMAEAEAEAMRDLAGEPSIQVNEELEPDGGDASVECELAALKKKHGR